MSVPRNLRYSPVNWLVVDWGFNGRAFNDCGLPQPRPCDEPEEGTPAACRPLPITEAIDTYDWERWLPEVIVGIEDPDEEIAANYVRQAAIEFCKGGRVLQREIIIDLQPHENTYPVFPYEGEQIIGVIAANLDDFGCCDCSGGLRGSAFGIDYSLDVARNEVTVNGRCGTGRLRLLVWAAPTEDSCAHDRFLYERFRYDITAGARLMYATAVHFRDRPLMASLPTGDSWQRSIITAKRKAVSRPTANRQRPGSGMWQTGGCFR